MTAEGYARDAVAHLLRVFARNVRRTATGPTPDTVHDLRVSIRRLSQALRVFDAQFPPNRVRRRLRGLRQLAGGVRDLDIAIEQANRRRWKVALDGARSVAASRLQAKAERLRKKKSWDKWSRRLGIA